MERPRILRCVQAEWPPLALCFLQTQGASLRSGPGSEPLRRARHRRREAGGGRPGPRLQPRGFSGGRGSTEGQVYSLQGRGRCKFHSWCGARWEGPNTAAQPNEQRD